MDTPGNQTHLPRGQLPLWVSVTSIPHSADATVVVLGVMTFLLQLSVITFFLYKAWRADKRKTESFSHSRHSDGKCPNSTPAESKIQALTGKPSQSHNADEEAEIFSAPSTPLSHYWKELQYHCDVYYSETFR